MKGAVLFTGAASALSRVSNEAMFKRIIASVPVIFGRQHYLCIIAITHTFVRIDVAGD